jgi:hypothetical protein
MQVDTAPQQTDGEKCGLVRASLDDASRERSAGQRLADEIKED